MIGRHFLLATLVAVVATWFTDWLFTGVLFHERYGRYPEVWRRPAGGSDESQAVVRACALGVLTCAAFVAACAVLHIVG